MDLSLTRRVEIIVISGLALIFTVFIFPTLMTTIDGISSGNALKPIFTVVPYVILLAELVFFIRGFFD